MRLSPGPSTRTCPSTNAAISEFVVPKSIPTMRSLMSWPRCRGARDLHLRRAKHLSTPLVPDAVYLENRTVGNDARFFLVDRVHPPGIERLSIAADRPGVELVERLVETLETELIPFCQRGQRLDVRVLARLREGACDPALAGTPRARSFNSADRFEAAPQAVPQIDQRAQDLAAAPVLGLALHVALTLARRRANLLGHPARLRAE